MRTEVCGVLEDESWWYGSSDEDGNDYEAEERDIDEDNIGYAMHLIELLFYVRFNCVLNLNTKLLSVLIVQNLRFYAQVPIYYE